MSEFNLFFKLNSLPLYKRSVKALDGGWYLILANKSFWVGARVIPAKSFPQTCARNSP